MNRGIQYMNRKFQNQCSTVLHKLFYCISVQYVGFYIWLLFHKISTMQWQLLFHTSDLNPMSDFGGLISRQLTQILPLIFNFSQWDDERVSIGFVLQLDSLVVSIDDIGVNGQDLIRTLPDQGVAIWKVKISK